jgi:hypothetical protein
VIERTATCRCGQLRATCQGEPAVSDVEKRRHAWVVVEEDGIAQRD